MATRSSGSLTTWRRHAIRQMVASRKEALAFLARLPEEAMLEPRSQDRWSAKDVLAHLVTCDEETIRRFRLIARGRGDRIHWFNDMADADRFNARSVAASRHVRVGTLIRRMERVAADVVDWFERLPIASLRDPSHDYPVTEWLPAPGWDHVREHVDEIERWWRSRRPRGDRPKRRPRSSRRS